MPRRERWLFGGAGAALILSCLAIALAGDLAARLPVFLSLYAIAFVAWAVAVIVALNPRSASVSIPVILAVAVAARIILLPSAPTLSTDIYRYLWEGRAVAGGHNPFAQAPDDPALEGMRDENYEGVSHKDMVTIYPPLAQAVFALAATLRNSLTMQKVMFTLFDLATILVLVAFLRARGRDPAAVVVYAWNPLVIVETAHSGHVDAVGIFFLVLALWWLERRRNAQAAVAAAFSFLSKYLAAILLPWALLRRRVAVWVPLAAAVVVAGYLPFVSAGEGLYASLRTYGDAWRFNGLAFRIAAEFVSDPIWVRRALAAAVVAYAVVQAVRQRDAARYAFHTIGAVLLAAPTLYPWYVAWIVPFLCLFPNRAWMLFTGLVLASYWVWVVDARGGEWALPWGVYAIEYVPFLGLLVYDFLRGRRADAAAVSG